MITVLREFDDAIKIIREQKGLYDYLVSVAKLPSVYSSEILRSQLVCAVSAMDRFLHEVVRVGFIEAYEGKRIPTDKYNTWQFSNKIVLLLIKYSDPSFVPSSREQTPEYLIEQDVIEKLSFWAFQHPDKIKEALAYIWDETHKFQEIAIKMGIAGPNSQKVLEQTLRLICERRNQIVHEGDIEPISRTRRAINQVDVENNINFIENFCHSVYDLITDSSCYFPQTP